MLRHCRARGLREGEFIELAILEHLKREEALEQCFQLWDALLEEAIIR